MCMFVHEVPVSVNCGLLRRVCKKLSAHLRSGRLVTPVWYAQVSLDGLLLASVGMQNYDAREGTEIGGEAIHSYKWPRQGQEFYRAYAIGVIGFELHGGKREYHSCASIALYIPDADMTRKKAWRVKELNRLLKLRMGDYPAMERRLLTLFNKPTLSRRLQRYVQDLRSR